MISAHRMLDEVVASLRNVIAPAIADPYPKTQAYMAAVILEILARSVEERRDLAAEREAAASDLGESLRGLGVRLPSEAPAGASVEGRIALLMTALDADRERVGEAVYADAKQEVRRALRRLLDQDLRVSTGEA